MVAPAAHLSQRSPLKDARLVRKATAGLQAKAVLRSFRPGLLVAALSLLGCGTGLRGGEPNDGGSEPPQSDAGNTATVPDLEVGTGTSAFEPLTDGQSVSIIFGPQGGYHVWAALRLKKSFAPERVEVHARLLQGSAELSDNGYLLNLVDAGDRYEWYGLQALVPDPAAIDGQPVTVRLEVKDQSGKSASAEVRVVPHKS
jgi:hypothetical protein